MLIFSFKKSFAATPLIASIRLTPVEIADSDFIMKFLIKLVFTTCVPPQSSAELPNFTEETVSPYFSPNKAITPLFKHSL